MPIPITIGVIGHRDIPPKERPRVVSQVRQVLMAYKTAFPNSPLLLLNAMAEGADQLAAQASAGLDDVNVLAVLPMSITEYAEDFTSTESRQQFLSVVSDAWSVIDVSTLDGSPAPSSRNAAYQDCARFISRNSHVLIAIWDGARPELPGGTADTIFYRVPHLSSLPGLGNQGSSRGQAEVRTIHIPCSRQSHGNPPTAIDGSGVALNPLELTGGMTWRTWTGPEDDSVCQALERANQELGSVGNGSRTHDTRAPVTASLRDACDAAAGRNQRIFRRLSASVLSCGVVALVLVALQQNTSSGWVMAFASLTIAILGSLWWVLGRLDVKRLFQRQRVIAEGARVQVVWLETGIEACVSEGYLVNQSEVSWIRTLLRSAWLVDMAAPFGNPGLRRPLEAATAAKSGSDWVDDQYAYFAGTSSRVGAWERNARKSRFYSRIGAAGLLVALVTLVPEVARALGAVLPIAFVLTSQALWELGLATVAATTAYAELMAFRESARRYSQSLEMFSAAKIELHGAMANFDGTNSLSGVKRVVRDVGVEALQETSSWFATSYDRAVRPV